MIKLIGAVLIIAGTAICGVKSVMKMRDRVKSLTSLSTSLQIMRSEICDRLTPIPEIVEMLQEQASSPANIFYRKLSKEMSKLGIESFADIWRKTVDDTPQLLLSQQEKQVLYDLGTSLGRYNVYEQEKAIYYAKKRIENKLKKAESDKEKDSKVQAFLGIAAGIFIVIIFL